MVLGLLTDSSGSVQVLMCMASVTAHHKRRIIIDHGALNVVQPSNTGREVVQFDGVWAIHLTPLGTTV
jgi:hypothetical protein